MKALLPAALLAAWVLTGGVAKAADSGEACRGLMAFKLPRLEMQEARLVSAGPGEGRGRGASVVLPEHCLVRGMIGRRTGAEGQTYGIGFELRLPTAWSNRFVFQGGGGLDGVLLPAYGFGSGVSQAPALARGYAVVTTDGGHRGTSNVDARFALDQQARIDYAYNAVDRTTLAAKALVEAFYGRPADHAYFVGCSNGGRQALISAQRLPLEFDGVVAGDPVFRLSWTNVAQTWNQVVLARGAPKGADGRPIISRALSETDLKLVGAAVLARCDDKDGLKDGMINDVRACRFDPAELTCKGAKTDRCLTAIEVRALKDLMSGPRDRTGKALYAAFPYDTGVGERAFRQMHFGSSPDGKSNAADATLGFDSLRYYAMTPPDPSYDPMIFDFDKDQWRIRETSKQNDADATFLPTFAKRGKLILYHGLSDQGLSPLDTAAWYDQLGPANGGDVHGWARLFLVPGMTHCAGGKATDDFDALGAIEGWVERGQAPDRIVARGEAFPGVTRPLCPYPAVARYQGGDAADERSFRCAP
ncbi:MAG: tannase/feruloyl esterase family alpha/beta hydrolase [Caulobacteraceae bacterium]